MAPFIDKPITHPWNPGLPKIYTMVGDEKELNYSTCEIGITKIIFYDLIKINNVIIIT